MHGETTTAEEERIATAIVNAAYWVHATLGPGLLESVYVRGLAHELRKQGFLVETEVPVKIKCDGMTLDEGFGIDLLVNKMVIIEVKSVEKINPVHQLQTKTYIQLAGLRHGFLINFNVKLSNNGTQRIIRTARLPNTGTG